MINFAKTSHHVVFGTLVAATTIGAAQAITDSNFIYSSPKTGFYSIDSAALTPENELIVYNSGLHGISPATAASGCFVTGVNLPNRATITDLDVWFRSGASAGGQPIFSLRRKKFSDGAIAVSAFRTVADDSGTR
jgi:hypothetical protein